MYAVRQERPVLALQMRSLEGSFHVYILSVLIMDLHGFEDSSVVGCYTMLANTVPHQIFTAVYKKFFLSAVDINQKYMCIAFLIMS
jgi:hypothetical protein